MCSLDCRQDGSRYGGPDTHIPDIPESTESKKSIQDNNVPIQQHAWNESFNRWEDSVQEQKSTVKPMPQDSTTPCAVGDHARAWPEIQGQSSSKPIQEAEWPALQPVFLSSSGEQNSSQPWSTIHTEHNMLLPPQNEWRNEFDEGQPSYHGDTCAWPQVSNQLEDYRMQQRLNHPRFNETRKQLNQLGYSGMLVRRTPDHPGYSVILVRQMPNEPGCSGMHIQQPNQPSHGTLNTTAPQQLYQPRYQPIDAEKIMDKINPNHKHLFKEMRKGAITHDQIHRFDEMSAQQTNGSGHQVPNEKEIEQAKLDEKQKNLVNEANWDGFNETQRQDLKNRTFLPTATPALMATGSYRCQTLPHINRHMPPSVFNFVPEKEPMMYEPASQVYPEYEMECTHNENPPPKRQKTSKYASSGFTPIDPRVRRQLLEPNFQAQMPQVYGNSNDVAFQGFQQHLPNFDQTSANFPDWRQPPMPAFREMSSSNLSQATLPFSGPSDFVDLSQTTFSHLGQASSSDLNQTEFPEIDQQTFREMDETGFEGFFNADMLGQQEPMVSGSRQDGELQNDQLAPPQHASSNALQQVREDQQASRGMIYPGLCQPLRDLVRLGVLQTTQSGTEEGQAIASPNRLAASSAAGLSNSLGPSFYMPAINNERGHLRQPLETIPEEAPQWAPEVGDLSNPVGLSCRTFQES